VKLLEKIALLLWVAVPAGLSAQQFNIAGHSVQFHAFGSQGFAYSDVNNYLTMPTSQGTFAFTDGGLTLGSQITDKLRVGAQGYVRNIGKMGNGQFTLDWASADYSFRDWLGIRVGKVKTTLGLYNDSQDAEFLHPWALMPQSTYPLDLRDETIGHLGADIYGDIQLKKMGHLAYTLSGGRVPSDLHGGYAYGLDRNSRHIKSITGDMLGADLRWTTPVKGLLAGASLNWQTGTADGVDASNNRPYNRDVTKNDTTAFYTQYTLGNLRLDGEYRRNLSVTDTTSVTSDVLGISTRDLDSRQGYVSAAYRINKWIQLGAYHSRFYVNWGTIHSLPNNHIFDQVATVRLDLNRYCDFKIEGHFIDGYGSSSANRGFYSVDNPNGRQPNTRLLVLRLGFHL
jgi:hypothetical protein